MSEHTLWDRFRNALGHTGHFTRIEFNPEAGVPDVNFCSHGVEGHIELKHRHDHPARVTTQVFGDHGLRESQIAWIHTRVRHGGRVWVLAQVGDALFLVPGSYCRKFNKMTLFQMTKASSWCAAGGMNADRWQQLGIEIQK